MATVRSYAELNGLLPPERRQRPLGVAWPGKPSVKDVIEPMGVPHTEVGLVVMDGEPVGFAAAAANSARIAVYRYLHSMPEAEALLRPPLPQPPRFVAGSRLGTLARYLRMLGFDTRYQNDATDEELANECASNGRVLLTRDRGLLKRRAVLYGCLIRSDEPRQQVTELLNRYGLREWARPFVRCLRCNGLHEPVAEADVLDRLEALTREYHDAFWRCRDCGNVVWAGTHHERMQQLIEAWRGRGQRVGRL